MIFRRISVGFLLFAGLGIMGLAASSFAQGPAKKDAGSDRVNWNEKKIAFEMNGKPWRGVFEWFADQSGMPYSSDYPAPAGTFTFINPRDAKGKAREYTLTEIWDIVNEILQYKHKHSLLRLQSTLTLVPADELLPQALIPLIETAELPERGRTDIIKIIVQLKGALNAAEIAPDIKRMLGDFGHVTPLENSNQLILQSTAANLRLAMRFIDPKNVEEGDQNAHQLAHKCKFVRAATAEALLTKSLGPQTVLEFQKGLGNPMPGGGDPRFQQPQPKPRAGRPHTITSDKATNTVFVSGPSDKIAMAKSILTNLDKASGPDDKGVLVGPANFKSHDLPGGNADAMVKILNEIFKDDASIRIAAAGPTRLSVWADPQTHWEINKITNEQTVPAQKTELVSLTRQDSGKLAETLKGMFPDSKNGSPFIEADLESNNIRLRGTIDQIKEVTAVIRVLDNNPSGVGAGIAIINLDKGSGATVAEAVYLLFGKLRDNPIEIHLPGNLESKGLKPDFKKPDLKPLEKPFEKKPSSQLTPDKLRQAMYFGKPNESYVSSAYQDEKPKTPDKKKPPVIITGFGNRIIVTSEDPEALDLARQIIRILVNTEAGPGDFEVIRLQVANAVEVAKILDEAFNGPKGQQGGGQRPPGGGGGGLNIPGIGGMIGGLMGIGGGGGGQSARVENIRVVADPATNSLLIRAKPIDMLTIRRLIGGQLDVRDKNSEALVKTHVIGPLKNASATEVADLLKQVYSESMKVVSQNQGGGGGFPFAGFGAPRPVDSSGTSRQVMLTLGVDNHNNTLIVNCPTTMYKEIKELVDQVDLASADTKQSIRVVNVKDIDPDSLAHLVDALSGRTTQPKRTGLSDPAGSGINAGSFAPGGFGTQMRGIGGGGIPGFGVPGGGGGNPGGFPGGGKGGGGKGGGKGRAALERGPDFFVSRVMDDPSVPVLYDPSEDQHEPPAQPLKHHLKAPLYTANPLHFTSLEQEVDQEPKLPEPKGKDQKESLLPPRQSIQVEQIEGFLILRGSDADLESILRIIALIRRESQPLLVEFELVPVRFGDPTDITNTLNILFGKVSLKAGNIQINPITTGADQQQVRTPGVTPRPEDAIPTKIQPTNMVLLAQPRLGAILVAASKARMPDIKKEIHRLDQPPSDTHHAIPFALKRAVAARVAASLNAFYGSRFPVPGDFGQVRITWDDGSNTVFVQASPADLAEVRRLVEHMDAAASAVRSEMRVVKLGNAVAQDLALLLQQSIANGVLTVYHPAGTPLGQTPGGGVPGGAVGAGQQLPVTKVGILRFTPTTGKNGKPLESRVLDDIRINFDQRTNALVISAPAESMPLVLALIADLDVQPNARSEINIFQLRKSDATQIATMLQQLFLNTGGLGARPGGQPAVPGQPAAAAGAAQARPLTLTVQGTTPEGAPIIDLRLTVDERTNSLIVAGSRNDLHVVESIIARIEDADVQDRRHEAVRLRNSQAVDVANAVTDFLTKSKKVYTDWGQGTNSLLIQRDVIVVAEPISNSLLVSATPKYFNEVLQLIARLDTTPPQVAISVLIAEVTMNGSEEFGMEIGLQMPLLFQRGTPGAGGTASYQTFTPGYNFNSTGPLGDNALVMPARVGFQGINNLGVGRASPTNNIGGFVFSAASDSVSVLIRALKIQGRINVLSRPQIMTLDNQTAIINVGQDVPIAGSTTTNGALGGVTQSIERKLVGVIMQVTPRITPDGRVLMRVIPEVSSVIPTPVNLGNGTLSTAFNIQHLETTVSATDGETILLGGLITKNDSKTENKIPWLGDLPGIGAAFRYRTYTKNKTELIIIMTPHIIRNRFEQEQILAEEARRIDWALGDVMRVHGSANCATIMPPVLHEPHPRMQPFRIFPGATSAANPSMQDVPVEYTPETQPVQQIQSAPQPIPAPPQTRVAPTGKTEAMKTMVIKRGPAVEQEQVVAAPVGSVPTIPIPALPQEVTSPPAARAPIYVPQPATLGNENTQGR